MPIFRWEIEFDAGDRTAAEEQVEAALPEFDSVVNEILVEIAGDGEED